MITGVILARNEEANIVDCLRSLRPHVGEILLVDMESTDRTVELARSLVSKVLSHPLIPNFDSARNIAIDQACFDWLWFLDADERVPEETGRLVNDLIRMRGHEFVALTIPFKTYFCGRWMEHSGWWPGYTMPRVLKRGFFRFGEKLHSGVQFSGTELRIAARPELAVDHFSYKSIEHYIEKLNRYTTGEAINLSQQGAAPDWRRGIVAMVRDLWLYYERNEGVLDRYRGWILAWLSGQYRWLSEAKLLDRAEQQAAIEQASFPENLDEVFEVAQSELSRLRGEALQLPLPVCLRSPLLDPSGYAEDGRTILKGLALQARSVTAREIRWNDSRISLAPADEGLIKALARPSPSRGGIAIANCIPTLCEPDAGARLNILRTTFETDRIPEDWLPLLERYDEVWVCSGHNERAFRRGGAAPERLRRLPQAVDTSIYTPHGQKLVLPPALRGRFVYLSVFDWQLRKGWDVLLRSYCREFVPDAGCGLLLKVSRLHGQSMELIERQANELLAELGQSLAQRPDIVIDNRLLELEEMAALYRAADAFVLASRGEGWGRPYLEAMACGLPVIGTKGSGNDDFMSAENSFPVEVSAVPVSDRAARELSIYAGHWWSEPSEQDLRMALRAVFTSRDVAQERARQALADVRDRYSIPAQAAALESALESAEAKFKPPAVEAPSTDQICVELEGEFFVGHSFSNVNERIAQGLSEEPTVALSLKRTIIHPPLDRLIPGAHKLAPYFGRRLPDGPQLTIRHAFPPNWEPPTAGKWIHIQPWEFGMLPKAWVVPLRDQVDEIWAPSQYVKDVYVRSSIPEAKIQVIPWGIDPDVYQPGLPDRVLPTDKSFRFLFVGGTLARKGFDLALDAYLAEFSPDEDVCLVVKDAGTKSFYRIGNYRERVLEASADPRAPAIVYLESEMTQGQRASLYCACQCLVAPYRGEGFGLPILEAMACGLPPIIPRGGPTDDFAGDETAFLLPARTVPCPHDWEACGQPTELSVELDDLRRAMRKAFEEREETRRLGAAASFHARTNLTWRQAIRRMTERIQRLAGHHGQAPVPACDPSCAAPLDLSVCVLARDCEKILPDCLARLRPFAKELLVGDLGSRDRTILIAKEYGAVVVDLTGHDPVHALPALRERATAAWTVDIRPEDLLDEQDWEELAGKLNNAAAGDRELAIGLSSAGDPGSNGHATEQQPRHWRLRSNSPPEKASKTAALSAPARANGHALKAGEPTVSQLDIAVVTVGYNLPGATRALVDSALRDCRHRVTFFIVSHSRLPEKVDELHELAHRSDVVYRDYGQNRGLAKSWNEGILWAYDSHFQAVLVVNEDVLFSPGDLARLAETAFQQSDRFLVTGRCFHTAENRWASSEYGCFALNRLALDTLGCFDENFFPVYCEDSDYRRRAALAGLQSGFCADVSLSHQGSASLREPEVARQNQETYWGNRAYYARKWGGDAGEETFPFPFNDRRFGVHIDRHVREVPYPGFNRTDQQLVLI